MKATGHVTVGNARGTLPGLKLDIDPPTELRDLITRQPGQKRMAPSTQRAVCRYYNDQLPIALLRLASGCWQRGILPLLAPWSYGEIVLSLLNGSYGRAVAQIE